MRSATTGFFSTFASTKSLMRHRSSQRLKNVAASLYGPGPCDTVKAVEAQRHPLLASLVLIVPCWCVTPVSVPHRARRRAETAWGPLQGGATGGEIYSS